MNAPNSKHGWPALMKAATARAYLDDMPIAEFAATVVPFLEARTGVGCIRYTRDSIDAWIGQGGRRGELHTAAETARARGDGAAVTEGVDLLERFGLITEEDLAALLGMTVKSLKNRPRSDLPTYVKAGRKRLFKEASVRAHLEARTVPCFDAAPGTGSPAGRTRTASATRSTSARRTRELLDGVLANTKRNARSAIK
jgi:hypothetical protein